MIPGYWREEELRQEVSRRDKSVRPARYHLSGRHCRWLGRFRPDERRGWPNDREIQQGKGSRATAEALLVYLLRTFLLPNLDKAWSHPELGFFLYEMGLPRGMEALEPMKSLLARLLSHRSQWVSFSLQQGQQVQEGRGADQGY